MRKNTNEAVALLNKIAHINKKTGKFLKTHYEDSYRYSLLNTMIEVMEKETREPFIKVDVDIVLRDMSAARAIYEVLLESNRIGDLPTFQEATEIFNSLIDLYIELEEKNK